MRINKFLALCGLGSRRKVEYLILDKQIKVNGKILNDLAYDVKEKDVIKCNDEIVSCAKQYEYFMLNKPKGFVTTMKDSLGRKTIMDLIKDLSIRVFPVGRLDYNTEGLLLLTNDGDLANRIMKPNYEINKTYRCTIEGAISESELATLRAGVVLDGKKLNKCKVKVLEYANDKTKLEITINQGLNRQIRRMMEYVGKNVVFLKRVSIGELRLGGLTIGTYRKLRDFEVQYLYELCNL